MQWLKNIELLLSMSILIHGYNFPDNLRTIFDNFLFVQETVLLYVMNQEITTFAKNKDKMVFSLFLNCVDKFTENFTDNFGQLYT